MKIESFFSGIKNANGAVDKLKQAGFINAFSDMNDHYVIDNNSVNNIPGTDTAPSLSSLVLNSGDPLDNPRKAPLAAASPMASGMGGFEEVADVNYRVIVEAEPKDENRIKQIIRESGGEIRDPNFKLPKGIENIQDDQIISNLSKE